MPKRNNVPWYRKPFDPQFMSKDELAKKIEKNYKKANDRLKALEKAGLTKASNAFSVKVMTTPSISLQKDVLKNLLKRFQGMIYFPSMSILTAF